MSQPQFAHLLQAVYEALDCVPFWEESAAEAAKDAGRRIRQRSGSSVRAEPRPKHSLRSRGFWLRSFLQAELRRECWCEQAAGTPVPGAGARRVTVYRAGGGSGSSGSGGTPPPASPQPMQACVEQIPEVK